MNKIIHRIFFNFDNTPDPFLQYLETWRNELPDFEIMLWDKNNLPLDLNPYTRYMAETRNHAFLSDYFRCWLLNKYGGVYLDADIEILNGNVFRSLYAECQLTEDYTLFIGIESERNGKLTAHSMGVKCGETHDILLFLMNLYETAFTTSMKYLIKRFPITDLMALFFLDFEKKENYSYSKDGIFTGKQIPIITKKMKIYPQDYFSPLSNYNNEIMVSSFSDNTCLCHHFAATWKKTEIMPMNLFSYLLQKNYYVISPELILEIKKRYVLPSTLRKPSWALSPNETAMLEKLLNKLFPYGGKMYSFLRKLRKR